MKPKKGNRNYNMVARADLVAQNEQNIMKATAELWLKLPIKEITLEKVAEISGVTVRTILRKFGSKEGLLEACIENDTSSPIQDRNLAKVGNLYSILTTLLKEYEEMGDAMARTIAAENEFPIVKKLLLRGQKEHRKWCEEKFAPFLPKPDDLNYESHLLAFIAATEIYLWKLLRRDLNQSFDQTFKVFQNILEGLIQKFQNNQIKTS